MIVAALEFIFQDIGHYVGTLFLFAALGGMFGGSK